MCACVMSYGVRCVLYGVHCVVRIAVCVWCRVCYVTCGMYVVCGVVCGDSRMMYVSGVLRVDMRCKLCCVSVCRVCRVMWCVLRVACCMPCVV